MESNLNTRMMRHRIRDSVYLMAIICSTGGTIYGPDRKRYQWAIDDLLQMEFIEETSADEKGRMGYTGTMAGQAVYAAMAGVLSSHIGIAAARAGDSSWLDDVQTK